MRYLDLRLLPSMASLKAAVSFVCFPAISGQLKNAADRFVCYYCNVLYLPRHKKYLVLNTRRESGYACVTASLFQTVELYHRMHARQGLDHPVIPSEQREARNLV